MDRLITFNCMGVTILLIYSGILVWRMKTSERLDKAKKTTAIGLILIALDYLLFKSNLSSLIMIGLDDSNPIKIMILIAYSLLPFVGSMFILIGLRLAIKK